MQPERCVVKRGDCRFVHDGLLQLVVFVLVFFRVNDLVKDWVQVLRNDVIVGGRVVLELGVGVGVTSRGGVLGGFAS